MNKVFGKYVLEAQLSRKNNGSVYLAHIRDDVEKRVVLRLFESFEVRRLLPNDFTETITPLRSLQHIALGSIQDSGIENDIPYVVTAYAAYGSLRDHLVQDKTWTRLSLQKVITLIFQLGSALAYAHEQNVVHGAVKPENVLFATEDDFYLADFDVTALFIDRSQQVKPEKKALCYLAPEQFEGKAVQASDQYALACMAYELFTGRTPFIALAWSTMRQKQTQETPLPPSHFRSDLPPAIDDILLKALAKNPLDRFPTILDFAKALHAISMVGASLENNSPVANFIPADVSTNNKTGISALKVELHKNPGSFSEHRHLSSKRPKRFVKWLAITMAILLVVSVVVSFSAFLPARPVPKKSVVAIPSVSVTTTPSMTATTEEITYIFWKKSDIHLVLK